MRVSSNLIVLWKDIKVFGLAYQLFQMETEKFFVGVEFAWHH